MNIFDDYYVQLYPEMVGAYVFLTFVLRLRKKSQPGKLILPGIELGPARREATMLPLDHSSDRQKNVLRKGTYSRNWPSQLTST